MTNQAVHEGVGWRKEEEDLTLRIDGDDDNGEYVELRKGPLSPPPSGATAAARFWYFAKLAVACVCLGIVGFFFFKWLSPPLFEKVIIPAINWERDTFSTPEIAVLVFASVALFPTFLLPSSPSMWMAGLTFGYAIGLSLIVPAVAIGVSVPFFIGSFFHHKIEEWLEKYPKRAAVLRVAGRGNWCHQFKAVALIRISPFPYIIYNYCAVATNVSYWPYLLGSLVGMVPDMLSSVYTGIVIQTLANTSSKKNALGTPYIVLDVVGFCMTVGTLIFVTVQAKRRLRDLWKEDELLLE